MQLVIDGDKSLQEVQHAFNLSYPYLKLEFFRPATGKHAPATANMLKHTIKIRDARRLQRNGIIEVYDSMKVSELEHTLQQSYGLSAQLFRKSGNVWLETTMSDNWTLQQQNRLGSEISSYTKLPEKPDQDDYREHQ
jgi:hypothetical protein